MYEYYARVVEVIDGDTVDVAIDLGFSIQHIVRLRLYGINTPEIRTRDLEEKALGIKATNRVVELVEGKIIRVSTHKTSDKYGRYLADIYIDDICINKLLLDEGLAEEYYGGKKK